MVCSSNGPARRLTAKLGPMGRANPVLREHEEETLDVTNQLGIAHATGVQAGRGEEKSPKKLPPACRPDALWRRRLRVSGAVAVPPEIRETSGLATGTLLS